MPTEGRHAGSDAPSWGRAPVVVGLGLGLVALGVACRLLRFGLDFPIWGDEASLAFNFVERDYRGLVRELSHKQIAPLVFLWIEKAVYDWAGPSELWLRLVPLLAGLGALALFWRLARVCLSPPAAVLAAGLLAVSWWPIELASSIKPYSLDLLLAVLFLSLAHRYLEGPQRLAALAAAALLAPVAVCLSYPAVFVAGAVSLVLLPVVWREGGRAARGWFVAFNVLLAGAFLAHLLLVGREKDPNSTFDLDGFMKGFWHHGFPHGGVLKGLWWCVRVHVGQMFSYPVEFNGGGAIGITLLALGAHALRRQGRGRLVLLCVAPFGLHFVAALLHRYPYGLSPRLAQHLLPGYCLLAGAGLAALIERWAATPAARLRALAVAMAGLAAVGITGAVLDCRRPYQDEVALWAGQITRHVQGHLRPGDVIMARREFRDWPVCLRWQMLPLADRVRDGDTFPEPAAGRVWFLDLSEVLAQRGSPEPASGPPAESWTGFGGTAGWETGEHRRFRADYPGEDQRVLHFYCDLYLCEPRRMRAAR